ncbi:MAG: peptide chain release factor-like protein [Patescibacteria group bacterium]
MFFPVQISDELIEKAARLGIHAEEIEEKFVRGSGAGGQKVNKTSSTVWLRHGPTGVEVKIQKHREREKNRQSAYKLLILKIEEKILGKKSAAAQKQFKIRKQKQRRNRKSKEKMLQEKHHRAEIKANRKAPAA